MQEHQGGKPNDILAFSNVHTDAISQVKRMQSEDFSDFTCLVPLEQMMAERYEEERGRRMKGEQWTVRRKWS